MLVAKTHKKITFSTVTAYVPVTLFLSLENKAYFFAQRFNSISVCLTTKCGIDEGIPKHQLTFNYFAHKKFNSEQKRKQNEIYIYRRVRSVIIFESVNGR